MERILVCLDEKPATAMLIRRGKRVADCLHGDCLALYVAREKLSTGEREAVENHLNFARNLRIDARVLRARDIALKLVAFARAHGVTQIYMGRSAGSAPWFLRNNKVHRVVRLARDMQVVIVFQRERR